MRRFIIKILIFFSICGTLDILVGYASNYLQKTSKGGLTQKDEFIKSKMNADIVIMGSSRASHHYVSNLMADSLDCSVYNAGMDGKGIIMNYGVLLEIIRRYNPKTIIYDLTPDFDWNKGDNEKYLSHLRQAYDIVGIDSIFWNVNSNERIKMLSKSYRANSLVPHLIYDNVVAKIDTMNGYIPIWGIYHPTDPKKEKEKNSEERNIDQLKAIYLQQFINQCNERNINLVFAISPILKSSKSMFIYGKEIAKKNNIKIIDFHNMKCTFDEEKLYQDNVHLNNAGANKYTLEIIKYLKNSN